MNFIEFTVVTVRRVSEKQVQVQKVKVPINVDLICALVPTVIPGEMAGPDGNPIGKLACDLIFGATSLTVENTVDEVKRKMGVETNESSGNPMAIPLDEKDIN